MANTTTTTGQPTSWTDFYESKRSEIASLKAVYVESFETLAEMTLEMKTGADLAITIASRTYNFLILTGETNSINLLHHCYNTTKTGNALGVVIGKPPRSKRSTQPTPCRPYNPHVPRRKTRNPNCSSLPLRCSSLRRRKENSKS
jgi:hypothetical protein